MTTLDQTCTLTPTTTRSSEPTSHQCNPIGTVVPQLAPTSHIIVDVAKRTPPNCYFEVDDCELDWQYKKASFDLIHTRDCYLSIRNWPRLVSQAYE